MLVATSAGKLSPLGVLPLHVQGVQGAQGAQGLQGQTRHGAEAEGRGARQEAIAELLAELATRRSVRVFVLQGPNVAAPISMLNALQVCCVSICEHSHTQGEGERAREKDARERMHAYMHTRALASSPSMPNQTQIPMHDACQRTHECLRAKAALGLTELAELPAGTLSRGCDPAAERSLPCSS